MDIVEELRKDRESGAKRLEAEYKAGLMTLARRFCHDPGDAEELVNRTFAAVVEGIDDFLEQSSFFTWMCQILSNIHAMDNRRLANKDIVYPGALPEVVDEDAREAIYRDVDAALLRDAVDRLPEDMRELLLLHYFMDMPVAKMAKILAVPCGTVRSKLFYARKALAAKLGVKMKEVAKKPGAKAVLLALALCALTAAGAAVMAAVHGGAQDKGGRDSERAAAILGSGGVVPRATASGGTGETSGTGGTGGVSLVASTTTPVPPDSPVPPVISPSLSSKETNMNKKTLRSLAAPVAAFTVAATTVPTMSYGESVWKDAVLWMNGPVDLNGNGKWDGNVGSPVQVKCDGTSAASELPDARHGALAYSDSQVVSLATGNQTVYENSGFQVRTNDVHFTAWGNKTVEWPCLYLPQTSSGNPDAPYAQRMELFADGGCPITGNNWSVLFRCRIEDCFQYNWGGSWLLGIITTDLGGAKELRIGFTQGGWTEDFSSPYYVGAMIGGGAGSTAFTGIPAVKTNEWLEVALTVEGQKWRMSCATPNGVRWGQTFYVPGNHGSYSTNFIPATISLGGPRAYGVRNGSDNFCGDIQMFAMWNRTLSDREVCEAFGGGAPNRFRIGEEGCTAEMYGGAAPAAGDTVTLDPHASDKRTFPTTLTRGATFNIPFSVDKYAAGLAHWLRFVPQEGSAGGMIAVAVDGNALDPLDVTARGVGGAEHPALIYIRGDVFTEGDHVLTLTRTDGRAGNVVFDVIELGGSWSAGVDDNSTDDGTSNGYLAGGYASDTWYADSLNLKEFVYATSRNPDDSNHRAKRIIWNLPKDVAERFDMRLSYNVLWFGESPMENSLVTYVNDVPVHTNSAVGWTAHVFTTDVLAEAGLFRDGENEIKIDFLPCTRTESVDWATFDMISAEPTRLHRLKSGTRIILR